MRVSRALRTAGVAWCVCTLLLVAFVGGCKGEQSAGDSPDIDNSVGEDTARSQDAGTWVAEKVASPQTSSEIELLQLSASHYSPFIRRSPDGEWVIRPAFDEEGSIYAASRSLGRAWRVFSLKAVLPSADFERVYWQEGVRPDAYFWAGDSSGVYVYYRLAECLFYVEVPSGEVSCLTSPQFFSSRDLSRQVQVLCSPSGSRDIVLLEKTVDNPDAPPPWLYRLLQVDQQGRVQQVIHEAGGVIDAAGTAHAVILALESEATDGAWGPYFKRVILFRISPNGTWEEEEYRELLVPALKQDVLSAISLESDGPWVVALNASGARTYLFPVPEPLRGVGSLIAWDDDGKCAYFLGTNLMVRNVAPGDP